MADPVAYPTRLSDMEVQITIAQTKAKLDVLERINLQMQKQLQAIFDGIARGDQVELVYPDGTIVPVTRARRRGQGEGGDT